ncbi:MAG: hypothetical protein WAV21_00750 [Minisyncoccia bacterium]
MYEEDMTSLECILPIGHPGMHVMRHPDGGYFEWGWDFECECCRLDEERCTIYREISEEEVMERRG